MESCDTLVSNTFSVYFECTCRESFSDSDCNVFVLNRGTELIIRLRLGLVFKLGSVPPVSNIGIGIGPVFVFQFSIMIPCAEDLPSLYCSYDR